MRLEGSNGGANKHVVSVNEGADDRASGRALVAFVKPDAPALATETSEADHVRVDACGAERPDGMSDSDRKAYGAYLHGQLIGAARRRSELDAREASFLREADEIDLHLLFGYASMREYLERTMGYVPHTATERLRVARALADLPETERMLAEGDVRYSVVKRLTRIATPDTEIEWLDQIEGKTCREVDQLLAGRAYGDRPTDDTKPDLHRRKIYLDLGPEAYAALREARIRLANEKRERITDDELIETICRRSCASAESGAAAEEGTIKPPAYRRSIKTCPECKRHWEIGGGRNIEVSPATASMADCDAQILGSLDAEEAARMTTTLTKRKREQVFERDGRCCAVPGCRSSWNIDIHHIVWQEHGGGHELSNVMSCCDGHHRAIHFGKLFVWGTAPDHIQCAWAHDCSRDDEDDQPGSVPRGSGFEVDRADADPGSVPRGTAVEAERPVRDPVPGGSEAQRTDRDSVPRVTAIERADRDPRSRQ